MTDSKTNKRRNPVPRLSVLIDGENDTVRQIVFARSASFHQFSFFETMKKGLLSPLVDNEHTCK